METSGRVLEELRILTPRVKPPQFLDRSQKVCSEQRYPLNTPTTSTSPGIFSSYRKEVNGIWDRTTKNAFPHDRQKGPKILPPHDAAGLLGGTRYHGRETPLKAKNAGPPEGKEDSTFRMHLNCHSPYSPWLKRRDVMGQAGFTGMQDETQQLKACRRTYAAAAASARRGYVLQGAAAAVVAPDVARRKLLGEGTPPASARFPTHLRVMCVGTGLTQADVDPGTRQHSVHSWRQLDTNSCPHGSPEPLLNLHTSRPHYKLDSRRTAAPHTLAQRPGTAAAAYGDARSGYYTNRVRADGVENILGCQGLEV